MNRLEQHARAEFRAMNWTDNTGRFVDNTQKEVCDQVLKLLEVFNEQHHSGSSAADLFNKLVRFEPIGPLTGEDWEWTIVSDLKNGLLWQNKRCSHVFKDAEGAYDIDGVVFYTWEKDKSGNKYKAYFTCRKSRVPVTFPYTPKKEYKEWGDKS